MLIGAHVGVSNGYPEALDYAVSVGCECVQIFAKSPRQWRAAPIHAEVAARFRERREELGIGWIVTHSAYLINLGSEDTALWERSWIALADELLRAETLGADAVVTHIGTNRSRDLEIGAVRVADGVRHALAAADAQVTLLLENTAGAGATFGNGPTEIGAVLTLLDQDWHDRLAVCLDTCHAHAAGWDLSQTAGLDAFVSGMETCCGAGRIQAIHANDCLGESGSLRDRHAWIGEGTIGVEGFARLFEHPGLRGAPAIVEMPGEAPFKDEENVRRLKKLRAASSEPAFDAESL
ncbi:MAG TPA: deoxyribonuclease IV [Coriobacteriia bacterium]|nr:deoxyribonuclease IV [Coriobacteriia bacterium]